MNESVRILVLISVWLGLAGLGHFIHQRCVYAVSSNFKEFTLVTAESSVSGISMTMTRHLITAHRADGSQVTGELSTTESNRPGRRFVLLVPERVRVEVHDRLRVKSTRYLPNGPAPLPSVPDPQCGLSRLAPMVHPTDAERIFQQDRGS